MCLTVQTPYVFVPCTWVNMRKLSYTTTESHIHVLAGKVIDIDRCKKSKAASKIDLSMSFDTAQNSRPMDIARVRVYDLDTFHVIHSSYLFEDYKLMTQLYKEYLSKNWRRSYQPIIMSVPPIGSRDNVVDLVLANFRKIDINRLNTFAELSDNLVDYVLSIDIR